MAARMRARRTWDQDEKYLLQRWPLTRREVQIDKRRARRRPPLLPPLDRMPRWLVPEEVRLTDIGDESALICPDGAGRERRE
jgi:hypothetical protein